MQSVTMETDMYHSGCLMHSLADTESHSHGSRPELKWKPLRDPMDREASNKME